MSTPNAAEAVVEFLSGGNFAGLVLSKGVSLFQGPRWMFPHQTGAPCVFVLNTGGQGGDPYLTPSRKVTTIQTVQVMFRAARDSFDSGERQARAIHDSLQFVVLPPFFDCRPVDATASFTGDDESGHPMFSSNFELHANVELGIQTQS